MWSFSQSSLPYLEKCISAAPPGDSNNKWFQKFGKKESSINVATVEIEKPPEEKAANVDSTALHYPDVFDMIESESTFPVEFVMQECSKNPELIIKLAEKLSTNSVEQLFKIIFSENREDYLTFITKFLPMYIKLNYSRLCVDFMVKVSEIYPLTFKELLQILINNTDIPNQALINYTATLNEKSATDFVTTLSGIEIISAGFSQNILVIYTAYKDCVKDDLIQNYLRKLLIQYSKDCATDRNFGRLFLTFLQSEKALGRHGNKDLEDCLEVHKSPFKRPCLLLLKEINQD